MKFLKIIFTVALLFIYAISAYGQEDSISTNTVNGYQAKTWSSGVEDFFMRIVTDTARNGTHSQSFYFRGQGGSYVEVEKTLSGYIQPTSPAEFTIWMYCKTFTPIVNNLNGDITIWVGNNGTWYQVEVFGGSPSGNPPSWGIFIMYPNGGMPTSFNQIKIRFNPRFTPPSSQMVTWEVFLDFFYVSHFGSGFVRWIDDFGDGMVGVPSVNNEVPESFSLKQNYPNPFNPKTNIQFSIPQSEFVTLTIFDMLGKEIEIVVNEELSSGTYMIDWDASKYSSGTYFYRIHAGQFTDTKKMTLIK